VTSTGNLGTDVSKQLLQYPNLLYIAAGTIFLLGFTPINFVLTTTIAVFLAFSAFLLTRQQIPPDIPDEEETDDRGASNMQSPENVVDLLSMDPIEFEFGYA